MAQFIDEASAQNLDATCVEKLRRPAFFTSFIGPKPQTNEDAP